jgi:RND family efflux transporter MFP subunit
MSIENVRTVMKNMMKIIGILMVLVGFPLILFQACAGRPGERREAQSEKTDSGGQVVLTADAAKTAGIRTEIVQLRTFYPAVKASGTVALNQRKYVKVTPRVPGRIERVFAFEGDRVQAGQDLFWLWSPDLMAVQAECLQILSRVPSGAKGHAAEDEKLQESLLRSTEARLKLMGFEEADLASLRTNRQALPVLAVRAPIGGTIVEAEAAVGSFVEIGTCLGSIADLTSLWVQVNIFEKDLASVAPGARAEIEVAAYPGEVFQGTLIMVGSLMDESTRTVKGRVEAANAAAKLKPGMFADVRIIAKDPVTILAVPEQAVRTIAGKAVVFLPGPGGTFVRRDIRKGRTVEGYIEVVEGLKEGERVVTDGSFDIKAEMLKGTLEGEK